MTKLVYWSNTIFVCCIICIFFILLVTVPLSDSSNNNKESIKIEKPLVTPKQLVEKHSDSFYDYIEAIQDNIPNADSEFRTVEYWMETKNQNTPK